MKDQKFRCGFIAIVGRPNVGKSTLMNHLIEKKISITSRKPQTTRHVIRGIYTSHNAQFIFVDTPGLNPKKEKLSKKTQEAFKSVDCILMLTEPNRFFESDFKVIDILPKKASTLLVVNKIDRFDEAKITAFINSVNTRYRFSKTIKISAKHHLGLEELKRSIRHFLPISEALYESASMTDQSERFLVSEILQEKLFRYFSDEIPYEAIAKVEQFKCEEGLYRIDMTIFVKKNSQKAILIGKAGEKLKKIATEARLDMEKLLNGRVFLKVWVKTKALADDQKDE